MTLNLSEMKDEPLGKHPIQEALVMCLPPAGACYAPIPIPGLPGGLPAAEVHSSTFSVVGLSDEALDPRPHVSALNACMPPPAGGCQACFSQSCRMPATSA